MDARSASGPTRRTDTLLAQAGHFVDPHTGGVVPPIHPATTYARDADYETIGGALYGRDDNPTFVRAEEVLKELEGGADALVFASGMAAATALLRTLRPSDHVVAPRAMYHGLRVWLEELRDRWGVDVVFYDDEEGIERALEPGRTRFVWVETPSNPTWKITDLARAAALAHGIDAQLVVDSTVATPILTRPLELGADYVFHSATKALNGHSDVIAGALVCREVDERWADVRRHRHDEGGILGPFEAWLLVRGMRTLHLRVRRACESAMVVARHFASHPRVRRVLYPGLEDHPGHTVAVAQMRGGFGSMLSLLVDADEATTRRVATRTRVFVPATSLGGVESLIEHRATVEGPGSPVPPELLRLSIGIEDVVDLVEDLERALAGA